jgi:hypothetical protein
MLREEVDGLRELGGRWATSRDVIERGAGESHRCLILQCGTTPGT